MPSRKSSCGPGLSIAKASTRAALGWILTLAPVIAGCDQGPTRIGATAASSSLGAASGAGDFACVGAVTWPHPSAPTATLRVEPPVRSTAHSIALEACSKDDPACAAPIDGAMLDPSLGDGAPAASLTVPTGETGWDGYVQIVGSSNATILAFELPPVTAARVMSDVPWSLVGEYSNEVAQAVGVTTDAARGTLGFAVKDCAGAPVSGVVVAADTADGRSRTIYLGAQGASFTGDASDAASGGMGVFFDLPPGAVTLTAKRAATGATIARVTALVRVGAVTTVDLAPTP